MLSSPRWHTVATSHAKIFVEERGEGETPVLMIHGNSTSRGVFQHQLQSELAQHHRLIAFDLPGHGDSGNAHDPHRSYTLPGLADAAIELLGKLGIDEVILFGWSLGGHIAIEMASRFPGVKGMMVVGAPPVGRDNFAEGFTGSPQTGAAGREHLTQEEIKGYIGAIFGASAEPFLIEAVKRCDGRFRKRLFEGLREGLGIDPRRAVETKSIPLAVINGGADRIINLDYFDTIPYANLWEGRCHRLGACGHAPFWEAPDDFNPYLERFLNDVGVKS
ncbi:alpha/beta fold hydrolase [Bradyrhizobium sp. SYSU BS000235]|uniref:alpha/beta fold hydrolase n=1 Tax=Bradyrhizobium sp. SYSU BS000235 TaxID=3411332 RepID=UPI003C727FE1